MGESGNPIISEIDATVTLDEVFFGFKEHFDGHRTSTELTFLELLRQTHPDFHVTCTSPLRFDLFGYASAGHAEMKFDSDDNTVDATRTFRVISKGEKDVIDPFIKTPISQASAAEGELHNHIRFGRWRYHWQAHEYLLYEVEYPDSNRGNPIKLYFVLSPHTNTSTKEGQGSPIDQLLLAVGAWSTQLHNEIYVFDDGYWAKSRDLWKSVQGASWEDVILDPIMKDNLVKDVLGFFDSRPLYKQLAVPWKRGVILHGVPGNGKTISIKALINTLDKRAQSVPSLYVKSFDSCQGEKHNIRTIFQHARKMSPCLLIFEDLDSLVSDETRSYFLNEVDGLESNDGILMIGSTNHLTQLDPAISKRPSRFDRKYHFNIPGETERAAYSQFWREKLIDSPLVEFPSEVCELIAKMTEGFSFAYLKELFVVTLLSIARGAAGDEAEQEEAPEVTPSEDGHVVVEHADAKADAPDETKKEEVKEEVVGEVKKEGAQPVTPPKVRKIMPKVAIPENLQDNVLIKVIKGQVQMLLDEMDNTEEQNWPSEKRSVGGVGGHGLNIRTPRRTMRAR